MDGVLNENPTELDDLGVPLLGILWMVAKSYTTKWMVPIHNGMSSTVFNW